MMAKPIRALELHYQMIHFLIKQDILILNGIRIIFVTGVP